MRRKPMGSRASKRYFSKTSRPKRVNLMGANMVNRGGIRL